MKLSKKDWDFLLDLLSLQVCMLQDWSNFGVWGVETVYFSISLDQGPRLVFILIHSNWYTYYQTLYLNVFCLVLLSYFM